MLKPRFVIVARLLAVLLAVIMHSAQAAAQCNPTWRALETFTPAIPGLDNGTVETSIMWDPDGPGPQPSGLVVGGSFTSAGGVPANYIAFWNGTTWSPLGTGLSSPAYALATLPNGDLVAGGRFPSGGGGGFPQFTAGVARWNGSSWESFGDGISGTVYALAVLPNGNLVAGGEFDFAGSVFVKNITLWDGSSWAPIGGVDFGSVFALAVMPNGELVVGGGFNIAGGVTANGIARWDGLNWAPLGSGVELGGAVYTLAVMPNGDLVAGGAFVAVGGATANRVARWNGSAWAPLGTGVGGIYPVAALAVMPNGDLVAGSGPPFGGGSLASSNVTRWNGSTWSPVGASLSSSVSTITVAPGGQFFAGGTFGNAGTTTVNRIARWNGFTWSALATPGSPLPPGVNATVRALAASPSGTLYAGGDFNTAGNVTASQIVRWNGSSWSAMGAGPGGGFNAPVYVMRADSDNSVVAAGAFTTAEGNPMNRIARWNGFNWLPYGSGINNGTVFALTESSIAPIAGGDFTIAGGISANRVAFWNGFSWGGTGAGLGTGTPGVGVNFVTALGSYQGTIIAAGSFRTSAGAAANYIARPGGGGWTQFGGSGTDGSIFALTNLPNGDLVAAGAFGSAGGVPANRIARWNGSSWSPLGTGLNNTVFALTTLPNGDLIAGGWFTAAGGVPANAIARWNGSTWSPLGTGMAGGALATWVLALTTLPNGDVVAGGDFATAGGVTVNNIARYSSLPTCYANCDCSSTAPTLNAVDFACFLNQYITAQALPVAQQAASYANCDGSTTVPALNALDFSCFLNRYVAGCP